jgi:DNA primase
MSEKWVNFKELRQRIAIGDVLAAYNVDVKVKGDQAHGFCPLPTHPVHEGKKRSASFAVNLRRGCWQCFSCGMSGNVIDLVCCMERMNPENPADIRKTALFLDGRFPSKKSAADKLGNKMSEAPIPSRMESGSTTGKEVVVNAPLEFELKHLDYDHPYLPSRGFSAETIKHFGLGFCSRGIMKDRVVIPLHDRAGQLIGYAGRVIDDALIGDDNPRYLFPSMRNRQGVQFEFHKSEFLYNAQHIYAPVADLIVVEGFASTWWLWQNGFQNAVAVMGSACSEEQANIIVNLVIPNGRVWVFSDNNRAGWRCAETILFRVAANRFAKCIWSKKVQPTDCAPEELKTILEL